MMKSQNIDSTCPTILHDESPEQPNSGQQIMMRRWRVSKPLALYLFLFLMATGKYGSGQNANSPGIEPFSTQAGSTYDHINLSSSNILINLPIRSKSGPIEFSFALTGAPSLSIIGGESIAWYLPTFGYIGQFSLTSGASVQGANVLSTATSFTCEVSYNVNDNYNQYTSSIVDSTGAAHLISSPGLSYNPCTQTYSTPIGSVFTTGDGSGYTAVLSSLGAQTSPAFNIYDRSGNEAEAVQGFGVRTVTTPNGVAVSETPADTDPPLVIQYNDPLGPPVLTSTVNFSLPTLSGTGATFAYQDGAGHTQSAVVSYTTMTFRTNFGCPNGPVDGGPTTYSFPTKLTLADNRSYEITYEATPGFSGDITGRIASISLPTGGSISYQYTGGNNNTGVYCDQYGAIYDNGMSPTIPTLIRTINDANGNQSVWVYNFADTTNAALATTTTVTDPAQNTTVYQFAGGYQLEQQNYQGAVSGGKRLKTTITCYNGNFTDCATLASSPIGVGGQVTQTDIYTSYNGGPASLTETTFNPYGLPSAVKQYDFGVAMPPSGTPLSTTTTTYGTWNGSGCVAISAYINDRPCEIRITNGTTVMSDTRNTYDGNGNLKTTAKLVSGATYITTSNTYNSNGTLLTSVDGNGNTTSYTEGACNDLLPTQISKGGLTTTEGWDCNGAVLTSMTEANAGQTTTYTYADPLYRLTATNYPDGGSTSICYSDVGGSGCSESSTANIVTTTVAASPDPSQVSTSTSDGLGRVIGNVSAAGASVTTKYNALGEVSSVSNPYISTSDSTYGITGYTYDAIGRLAKQTNPDSSIVQYCYDDTATNGQNNCNGHIGTQTGKTWIDKMDESGNSWQYTTNGAGNLVEAVEPNGTTTSPSLETDYSYDALNDVISIAQCGGSCPSSGSVVRSFSYDGLKRLTASANPEAGAISYSYDGNGNVLTKVGPAVNVTSGTQTIGYCYDPLDRIVGKWSAAPPSGCNATPTSSSSTLLATYSYGAAGASDNTAGQLIDERSYISGTLVAENSPYSYDLMGRLTGENQYPFSPSGNAYGFTFSYDYAGNLTSHNNGISTSADAISFQTSYNNAGQLAQETVTQPSAWSSASYPTTLFQANAATTGFFGTASPPYDAMGHLVYAQLGLTTDIPNGTITTQRTYDKRERFTSELDGGYPIASGATTSAGQIALNGTEQSAVRAATQATGSVTISGTEGSGDTGAVSVTVDGFTGSAFYGSGSTDGTVASALAAALSVSGSPVTATSNGAVVAMTSIAAGTSADYAYSISNGTDFTGTASGTTLTGGSPCAIYDAGTITVSINNIPATISWGSSSTAANLATALASAINTAASSIVTATANQGSGDQASISLASNATGSTVNYSVIGSETDSQTGTFSTPSFGVQTAYMDGGTSAASNYGAIYAYSADGGYTPSGNLIAFTDSVTGEWSLNYDTLNRLAASSTVGGHYAGEFGCWVYDAFGNMQQEVFTTANSSACASLAPATYPNNRSPSLAYDAAGDVTVDPKNSYAYDAEGRICAVAVTIGGPTTYTQYIYNAEGRLVAKGTATNGQCGAPTGSTFSLTNQYLLGQGGEQVTELNGSTGWLHTNAWVGGKLLATYDGVSIHFALTDPLGTKRVQVEASGTPELNCASLPFGDDVAFSRTTNCYTPTNGIAYQDATENHFTGKERDIESGLDYFGARYYSSSTGRFSSPDPSGLFFADPTLPQSLNLYSYARNNPLIGTDPTGMAYCQWDDGTHDDSANTGAEGAVNSGTECTNAGGTWSHDDGLNDDGSQMGTEGKASLTVTATLNTSTDETSVSTTGESYDPDNANLYLLSVGITEDTNHAFGCIASAYGVGAPSAATGTAGSQVFSASQNLVGKTKAAGALGGSTAYTSEAAMAARSSALANIPSFGLKSPVGTPFAGNFAMRTSPNMGVAAGRYAPYIGAAGKAAGVAGTAYSSYKLWNCLGTHP